MWLGMLAAAGGQVPGFPVEAVNAPAAVLLAYIAQVATWCARPSWASLEVSLGLGGLAVSYAAIAVLAVLVRRRPGIAAAAAIAVLCATAGGVVLAGGAPAAVEPPAGLRVTVLDVGQGDAILMQPAQAPPVLVDGGPPGDGLVAQLADAGVGALGAAVLTHDQSDHAGGIEEALGELPVHSLLYAVADRRTLEEARSAGTRPRRIAAGSELRSGDLRLDTIWPPPALLAGPHAGEDPNRLALVTVARWHGFSMLLTADAEAESTPIDPGPIDVLKVAHHGSDDAGLGALLARIRPSLAVISVGADNTYGHPTAATLAELARHGVRTLRTDRDGAIVLEVRDGAVSVAVG